MDKIMEVYGWLMMHKEVIFAALFAISEMLALIPQVKSNSVFQLIVNAIKGMKAKLLPNQA